MKRKDIDRRVLEELIGNARLSFRKIATRIGTSTATVASSVRRLKKAGIIRKFTTAVDYEKLGYSFHVIIEIKIRQGKLFNIENAIASNPCVFAVYDHTGQTDTTVLARFRSRSELDSFIKQLQKMKYVERTETKLVLNIIKDER